MIGIEILLTNRKGVNKPSTVLVALAPKVTQAFVATFFLCFASVSFSSLIRAEQRKLDSLRLIQVGIDNSFSSVILRVKLNPVFILALPSCSV